MNPKRLLLIAFLSILSYLSFSQSVNVLKLKNRKFYTEKDIFTTKPVNILCEVCYDHPDWHDEEHCNSVTIFIKDSVKFWNSNFLDLEKDSLILICFADRISTVNSKNKRLIYGNVKVLSLKENEIKLDLNIYVDYGRKYYYKGIRIFRKTDSLF